MRSLLIIDDHPHIRENIAEILSLAGYKTFTAENGKRGVEIALQDKPDLIICDIMMPELDGYGVLHLLRKNPATEFIPFIFLTARSERTDMRKGMEMGADDYITKPFDDIELLNAVETRLKKADILHKKYESSGQGASAMINDLRQSGLLKLEPDNYESYSSTKKTTLYAEGKRPKYLFYLKSGKVKEFRQHEDGKEYIVSLHTAGDYVGYLPLLENLSYDLSAEVLEEAEVVQIPREDFLQAVYNDMSIAGRFIRLIAQNVQEKEDRLLQLAYGSLRKRVAKALIDIHQKFNTEPAQLNTINMSRDDLAHYVGTATESLIRTLSDFKSEKLIEIKDGKICLLNREKLQHLLY
jgi:DNA-binding response OmpR family regulator